MAGSRRRAREVALQVLYSQDVNPDLSADEALTLYFGTIARGQEEGTASGEAREGSRGEIDRPYAEALVRGVALRRAELDELIGRVSRTWRIERMARLDRNVLRLATWELRHAPDVPTEVVINEAVDLAKRFGSAEAPAFVNGILDSVASVLARPSS